ncbi:MAG: M23 family metallopeptidase [Acidobacteria bacterium]|nr:M23 family metallopeptidase [Acidobacteriota bacterium]
MKRLLRACLIIGTLAGGSLSGHIARGGNPAITVTHQARSLQPGEVVVIRVTSPSPLSGVEGAGLERTILFFPDASAKLWTGLLGIDLETRPGGHTVRLRAVQESGQPAALEHTLRVVDKTFPTRRLTVDEKFVTPPPEVLERIQRESRRLQAVFEAVGRERLWRGPFVAPVPGPPISEFGKRNILNGRPRSPHSGTDFKAAAGTPILAPNAGNVVLAEDLYYSGNTVIIDHGLGLFSYFAHLSSYSVAAGDKVKSGEHIGKVGATGRVTGPHLHWSVRLVGARVDPLSLMSVVGK